MRSDYRVVTATLAIILCLMGVFWFVDDLKLSPKKDNVSNYLQKSEQTTKGKYFSDFKSPTRHLVTFDPNSADSTVLLGLGLPEWTVRSIYKYRAKGGVFSTPEDFGRMNGITVGLYRKLKPYISISDEFKPASEVIGPRIYNNETSKRDTTLYPTKLSANERISINDADTNALKRVPGLGSYYAKRIVDLRNSYGGFISLEQLLDIKGLPETALQYFSVPDGEVKKININKATFVQLQSHPYIGYFRAKVISDYRRLKGKISSLGQLSLLKGFGDKEIQYLEPYIEF